MTIGGARPRPAGLALQDPPLPQTRGAGRTIWEDRNMKKRLISWLLILALCVSVLPAASLAAEPEDTALTETEQVLDQSETEQEGDPDESEQTLTPAEPLRAVSANSGTETHKHYLCGGATCNKEGHEESTYENTTFMEWKYDSATGWPTRGNFYLTGDVTLSNTLTVSSGNLTLCLNGYSIKMDTVKDKDVIKVENGRSFTLCDCKQGGTTDYGTIGHTQPSQFNGRGVNVEGANSRFTMYGGRIANNMVGGDAGDERIRYGGGVLVCNKGIFSMVGGEITGNTAKYGGGVAVGLANGLHDNTNEDIGGFFNMHGGRIYGNICTYNGGGGVYAAASNALYFYVSDAPQITDNIYKKDTNTNVANNVYLSTYTKNGVPTPAQINVSQLTDAASIGVTTEDVGQTVASGISEADAKHFFSDAADRRLQLDGTTLTMVASKHEAHPICGDTSCSDSNHQLSPSKSWTAITSLNDTYYTNTCYYLTKNVTITETWKPKNGVTLCLNGYSIIADGDFDAITVGAGKTFTLCDCVGGGTITHAAGKSGAGVYMEGADSEGAGSKNAYFYMYGGKITGNTGHTDTVNGVATTRGGGVYVGGYAQFSMRGGSITGNTAAQGGGVYYTASNSLYVSGNVDITGNKDTDDNNNNVYVLPSGGAPKTVPFYIGQDGLAEEARIGVRVNDGVIGTGEHSPVAQFAPQTNMTSAYREGNFIPDNGSVYGFKMEAKEHDTITSTHVVNLYNGLPHQHPICGETCTHTGSDVHTDVTWTPLTSENGEPYAGSTKLGTGNFNATVGYVLSAGHYYLSDTLNLNRPLLIKNGVYLCLNGQTLSVQSSNSAVIIDTGCDLTLCDCSEEQTGKITHAASATGRGVYMGTTGSANSYNGRFTMYGGSITGNTTQGQYGDGAGVYMKGKGTFNMYGGSITGNTTADNNANGNGVYVEGGTFNMTGDAVISNNTATGDYAAGGGVYAVVATFNMSGNAVISNNNAYGGGGVYVNSVTFNMSGNAAITGNTASLNGGGVYVTNGTAAAGTFTMSGNASISGNSANYGGGVYVRGDSSFTMTGGSITGNNVSVDGGGVYVYGYTATMTVSGNVQIRDNWKGGSLNSEGTAYVQGTGSANNFYLFGEDGAQQQTITIGGELTGAKIGITTSRTPTADSPVQIATGATENLDYYTNIFTPDVTDYTVTKDGTTLYLSAHEHHWKYEKAANGEEIMVSCDADGCDLNGQKIHYTLCAPATSTLTYDGNGKPAKVIVTGAPANVTTPQPSAISYMQTQPTQLTLENGAEPTNAGTYYASVTVGTETATVKYTIAPARLVITARSTVIDYGSEPVNDGVEYQGFVNNETEAVLGGDLEFDHAYNRYGNVGDYDITPKGLTSRNYDITFLPGKLQVKPRLVTITWNNTTGRTYGDNGGEVTATANGTVNGDVIGVTVSGNELTVGDHTAIATGLTGEKANNYKLPTEEANRSVTYKVGRAAQTLTFTLGDQTKTYGDPAFANAATNDRTDGAEVQYSSDDTNVATVDNDGKVTIVGAGTAKITATAPAVDDKYSAGSAEYTLTVNKKTLTADNLEFTTDTITKTYDGDTACTTATVQIKDSAKVTSGDELPTVTGTYAYNSKDVKGATKVTFTSAASDNTNYILPAGLTVENNASITPADQATLTVTSTTATYGTDLTLTVSGGSGDGAVTYTVADGTGKATVSGSTLHPVQAGTVKVTATKASDGNYNSISSAETVITIAQATYTGTLTPKVVNIVKNRSTAQTGTLTAADFFPAGQEVPADAAIASVTPDSGTIIDSIAVEGTAAHTLRYVSKARIAAAADESYSVTIATTNYADIPATLTFHLTDKQAQNLSFTTPTVTATYKDPTFTQTVNSAHTTVTYTSSKPSVATVNATTGEVTIVGAGETTITATAAETDVYASASVSYTLKVNKLRIHVPTAGLNNKLEYNGKEQTYTPDGLDTTYCSITDNTEKDVLANNANYTATVSLRDTANTEWDEEPNGAPEKTYSFRITPAPLTVTALDKKITTGQPAPELSKAAEGTDYTIDGLFDGDSFSNIELYYADPADTSDPKKEVTPDTSKAGTYAIVARLGGGTSSPNYDPTFVPGTLTIEAVQTSQKLGISAPGRTPGGSYELTPKNAKPGDTVTITVSPDKGYELGDLTVRDVDGNELDLKRDRSGDYTFTMPKSSVSVSISFVREDDALFDDVFAGDYYYNAVQWAAEQGITGGVSKNLFAPDAACTRAQIVTFLWRAAGSPAPKTMSAFADVPATAYYAKAVAWAVENGITNGTGDGKFSPDAPCTRAQAVTFLARALDESADGAADFTDVSADAYYAKPVAWAVEANVTNGVSKTQFAPNETCTRAQIVTFLYRAYRRAK